MKYDKKFIKENLYSGIFSDILDEMGYNKQALSNKIAPLQDDTVIFGPAFTSIGTEVYSMPSDPLTAQCKVVDQLKEDEVYIVVIRGNMNCAVFGELFATAVLARKGAGVLVDGYVRDVKQLKEMNFPVFHAGTNVRTSKGRCEINECQIPILVDGVTVNPGDYIFGDADGVIVIPQEIFDEVLDKAVEHIEKENVVRETLRNGGTLEEAYRVNGAI